MADQDLAVVIDQYAVGLEAEIQLLRRVEEIAVRQQAAAAAQDIAAGHVAADERDRLMAGIVSIEQELRQLRQVLAAARDEAKHLPNYPEAAALHQEAVSLVGKILKSDEASIESLASAELARRDAARAIERGETTLAAYRKVVALAPGATLVDRRG